MYKANTKMIDGIWDIADKLKTITFLRGLVLDYCLNGVVVQDEKVLLERDSAEMFLQDLESSACTALEELVSQAEVVKG